MNELRETAPQRARSIVLVGEGSMTHTKNVGRVDEALSLLKLSGSWFVAKKGVRFALYFPREFCVEKIEVMLELSTFLCILFIRKVNKLN